MLWYKHDALYQLQQEQQILLIKLQEKQDTKQQIIK